MRNLIKEMLYDIAARLRQTAKAIEADNKAKRIGK